MANVNGIDLEEFIEETMHKVMNGVRKVTEKVGLQDENGNFIAGINIGRKDTSVDFDVALTVSQDAKGGGGLKIAVLVLEGTVTTATQSVHRIKFSVPVTFASQLESRDGSDRSYSPRARSVV